MKTTTKAEELKPVRRKGVVAMKRRIERAQRLVRKYLKPGTSLADELIAERRSS